MLASKSAVGVVMDTNLIVENCYKQTMRHVESVNEIIRWFAREIARRALTRPNSLFILPHHRLWGSFSWHKNTRLVGRVSLGKVLGG